MPFCIFFNSLTYELNGMLNVPLRCDMWVFLMTLARHIYIIVNAIILKSDIGKVSFFILPLHNWILQVPLRLNVVLGTPNLTVGKLPPSPVWAWIWRHYTQRNSTTRINSRRSHQFWGVNCTVVQLSIPSLIHRCTMNIIHSCLLLLF